MKTLTEKEKAKITYIVIKARLVGRSDYDDPTSVRNLKKAYEADLKNAKAKIAALDKILAIIAPPKVKPEAK